MGEDVEKSLYLSYTEILKGLHFIKDAIDFVEQGKDYYVIPLSGQLRAIFVLPHDKNVNLKNYTVGKKGKTQCKGIGFMLSNIINEQLSSFI